MHKITIDETEEDVMVAVLHKRTKEMLDAAKVRLQRAEIHLQDSQKALKQYEEQLKLKCW